MRLLVATRETNGAVVGDHDACLEGELVYMQTPCPRDMRDPEGGCGCGRAFIGMYSHGATTTAMVVESPLSPADVRAAMRWRLEADGWFGQPCTGEMAERVLDELLGCLDHVTSQLPVGGVVRRRLDDYYVDVVAV